MTTDSGGMGKRNMMGKALLFSLTLSVMIGCALSSPGQAELITQDSDSISEHSKSLTCLADAIAYEAGNEPIEGQEAVAQVIMNRLRDSRYPKTLCEVVYQGSERRTGCQFTFTCDGSRKRKLTQRIMTTTRAIAEAALDGTLPDRVPGSTLYHADYVSPRWAPQVTRITQIGAHIFYKAQGGGHVPVATPALAATGTVTSFVNNKKFAPWGLPMMSQ